MAFLQGHVVSCLSLNLSSPASSTVHLNAALTLSFHCLGSIKASQLPKAVVLKVWSLVSPAQNPSLYCLIRGLGYDGHICIRASTTHHH